MFRRRTLPAVGTILAAVSLLAGPLSGPASAAPPSGQFLNPDDDGPGHRISDKPDGTDDLYHFVVRLKDPEGLNDISGVEIQIEDGDPDQTFETIGTATRVGTTDTWELKWDQSAYTPQTDVDNDPGFVRAGVFDSSGGPFFVPSAVGEAVVFRDQADETAEITNPANGASLGFFDGPDADTAPEALMEGTASSGVDQPSEIELFYTTQSDAAVDPAWVDCEQDVTVSNGTWRGLCELAGSDTPASVTGVAVRTDITDPDADEVGDESGDAHRVTGYAQTVQGSTITVEPAADTQSIGFCNTYVAVVRDAQARPIIGANIDVHATGPADDLQFAVNQDDPNDADEVSDAFSPPDMGLHSTESAAGCDTAGEAGEGDAPEDNDSNATGQQGTHPNPAGSDTKHIEGNMDFDGFQFSIDSETAGTTNIEAWFDADGNDIVTPLPTAEPTDTATKSWQVAAVTTVDASPEEDTNEPGSTHTVTAQVTDQNGNPMQGVTVRFRVMAGPHADNDLDGFAATPPGYFGSCTTDANGRCSQSYQGTEAGADRIAVWVNSPGETGAAVFEPDEDDPQDEVVKKWFVTPAGPVCIDTDPNTATVDPGATREITAFVTDGVFDAATDAADAEGEVSNDCSGAPLEGVGVSFQISDDDPDAALVPDVTDGEDQESVATDASGAATVSIENQAGDEGTNTVTADVEGTNQDTGDTDASVTWLGPRCPGREDEPGNHIIGTAEDDELTGTPGRDVMCGLGGDDVLESLGGNDLVLGGGGNDDVLTGAGGDDGIGGGGADEVRGGKGADDLKGNRGNDGLFGQKGPDDLTGGLGVDFCKGGPGADQVKGCEN